MGQRRHGNRDSLSLFHLILARSIQQLLCLLLVLRGRIRLLILCRRVLLVLRRRFVDELMRSDPACAAEVLFGLARVLADRQYAPAS